MDAGGLKEQIRHPEKIRHNIQFCLPLWREPLVNTCLDGVDQCDQVLRDALCGVLYVNLVWIKLRDGLKERILRIGVYAQKLANLAMSPVYGVVGSNLCEQSPEVAYELVLFHFSILS